MKINLKYSHFKAIFPKTNSLVFCFLSKKVIIENESNENQLSLTDENEQNPKLEPIEIKEEKEEMLSSNEKIHRVQIQLNLRRQINFFILVQRQNQIHLLEQIQKPKQKLSK